LLGTAPLLLLLMLQRHGPLLLRSLLLLIMLLLDECDVNDQIWSPSSLEVWCSVVQLCGTTGMLIFHPILLSAAFTRHG
jgi:hypothetical protein